MRPDDELSKAWQELQEDRYREQYRRAMRILRTIPSGTPDSDLTDEQRQAWADHDEAIAWLKENA